MISYMDRAFLFWGVCIPSRLVIALAAPNVLLRPAAAFVSYNWLSGAYTNSHGFFGGRVWWAKERKLHGALWGAYVLTGDRSWLLLDVGVGAVNWFLNSNF